LKNIAGKVALKVLGKSLRRNRKRQSFTQKMLWNLFAENGKETEQKVESVCGYVA